MPSKLDRRRFLKQLAALLGSTPMFALIPRSPIKGEQLKAEASVLLASLVQPEQFPDVQAVLSPQMFQDAFHLELYGWMGSRRRNGLPFDWESVGAPCMHPDTPQFQEGLGRIWGLVDDRPDAPNAFKCALKLRSLHDGSLFGRKS